MDVELQSAWAEWLGSQRWDYFLTVTFREPVPASRAGSVLNSVEKSLREFEPESLFLGAEEHVSRFLHVHGLFRTHTVKQPMFGSDYPSHAPRANAIWEKLFRIYGYSRVELVRSNVDASHYVTKYCVKNLAEYLIK